jgi:hypothetical protein
MAGVKKGQALIEDAKRLPVNEREYPEEVYLAKKLVMNMDKMGAPVVVRDGIPSYIRVYEHGIYIQPLDTDDLYTELKRFSLVKERSRVKGRNPDGSVMYGPDGKTVRVEGSETAGRLSNAVLRHAKSWLKEIAVPVSGYFTFPVFGPGGTSL